VREQNPPSGSAFRAIRAIDYTVISVRDMTAMRRFYEDILGFGHHESFLQVGSNVGWATTR
jgi:catechol-2,3-dioxygenase